MPNELTPDIDIQDIVKMRLKGVSYEVIGLKYGRTRQAIARRLSHLKDILEDTELSSTFENNEIEMLARARNIILPASITPEKIKESSGRDLAVMYGIYQDKARLLKGESTSNIDHRTNAVALKKESDELQAIEDQLKELELVKTDTPEGIVYTTEDNK